MVAQECKPARMFDNEIKAIAVGYEVAPPVGRGVDNVLGDLDPAEMRPIVITQEFVMISRNVVEPNAAPALSQQFLHHVIVGLRPIPARFQLPAINDVADEVDDVSFMTAQEIKQALSLTASRS